MATQQMTLYLARQSFLICLYAAFKWAPFFIFSRQFHCQNTTECPRNQLICHVALFELKLKALANLSLVSFVFAVDVFFFDDR